MDSAGFQRRRALDALQADRTRRRSSSISIGTAPELLVQLGSVEGMPRMMAGGAVNLNAQSSQRRQSASRSQPQGPPRGFDSLLAAAAQPAPASASIRPRLSSSSASGAGRKSGDAGFGCELVLADVTANSSFGRPGAPRLDAPRAGDNLRAMLGLQLKRTTPGARE